MKRIAISLDDQGHAYIQRQKTRLRSLSDSELVRNLLREHETLTTEVERLSAELKRLERLVRRLQRHRDT